MPGNNDTDKNTSANQSGLSWSTPATASSSVSKNTHAQAVGSPPLLSAVGQNGAARYVSLVVAGVIVGIILAWAWSAFTGREAVAPASQVQADGETSAPSNPPPGSSALQSAAAVGSSVPTAGTLVVSSPQKAGTQVSITKAVVLQPTWIVVYESSESGWGNALGARLFFPGQTSGTVVLLRATQAGKTYVIGESRDNGDHVFSRSEADTPVVDAEGKPIQVEFRVE